MKLFKRIGIAALLTVCAVAWAGSAWASIEDEAQAIREYGLGAEVTEPNTITITGSKTDATETLWLGRFADSDITYKWNATLKADCGTFPAEQDKENLYRNLIAFHNDEDPTDDYAHSFEIIGGEIDFTDVNNVREKEKDEGGYVNVIFAPYSPNVHIILNGGKVGTDMRDSSVISAQEDGKGATVTLKKGELNAPYSSAVGAANGRFSLNEAALQDGTLTINGSIDTGEVNGIVPIFVYGTRRMDSATNTEHFELDSYHITLTENASAIIGLAINLGQKAAFVVENNATLTIEDVEIVLNGEDSTIRVKEGGVLNNHGTIVITDGKVEDIGEVNNYGTITVNGELYVGNSSQVGAENFKSATLPLATANATFNNYGTTTVSSAGKLTSNGTINNKSTGKITIEGTFISDGEFNAEPGSKVEGDGQIDGANADEVTSGTEKPSGSGGGCNTGLSLFGLLLAGILTFKCRKA
jgi:hypothetical protein